MNNNNLIKIISLVSLNRGIREGEVNGVDYNFISKEEVLDRKEKGLLMQYTAVNDVHYGYEKSSFEKIKELIVLCAESGAGKDSVMEYISKEYGSEFIGETAFLFSVPDTIHLFVEYGKENNINVTVVFIDVEKDERFKRVVAGGLKERHPDLEFEVLDGLAIKSETVFDSSDVSVIQKSRNRIERFKVPFSEKIAELNKDGFDIKTIDGTNITLAETAKQIMDAFLASRKD